MLIRGADVVREPGRHGQVKQALLRDGSLPGIVQIATATLVGDVEMHSHPTMTEVFYVLDGTAEYCVGADRYTAIAGDLIVVTAGQPHSIKVNEAPHRVFYWGIAAD